MKQYSYIDNWSGARKEFTTLREAKKSSAKETGNYITIYKAGKRVCEVKATGFCPA